jgi:prolyl 4-hydroxylase
MFSVYNEPKIINNFLTPEECKFLIDYKNEDFVKSMTSASNGISMKLSNHRISKHKSINDFSHPTLQKIYNICSKITKKDIKYFEPFQVVHYETGGHYSDHHDYSEPVPRIYTFIIYLNEDYEGGETYFTKLNKKFKLKCGDALFFPNLDSNNNITELSLHKGSVVKSGEKWICNIWIHSVPLEESRRRSVMRNSNYTLKTLIPSYIR